jgi:hypothetical protein
MGMEVRTRVMRGSGSWRVKPSRSMRAGLSVRPRERTLEMPARHDDVDSSGVPLVDSDPEFVGVIECTLRGRRLLADMRSSGVGMSAELAALLTVGLDVLQRKIACSMVKRETRVPHTM